MIRLVTFVFCWKTNQRTVACLCCTSESSCRRSTNSKLQFYVYTSGLWAIAVMHYITRAVPTLWFIERYEFSILKNGLVLVYCRGCISVWHSGHQEVAESYIATATSSRASCLQRSQNKQENFPLWRDVSHLLLTLSDLQHSPVFVCWLLSHWSQFEVFLWGLGSTALQI